MFAMIKRIMRSMKGIPTQTKPSPRRSPKHFGRINKLRNSRTSTARLGANFIYTSKAARRIRTLNVGKLLKPRGAAAKSTKGR
jgi:hypothetical protein